jgi:Flp pilus assembly CpaF family ATPase
LPASSPRWCLRPTFAIRKKATAIFTLEQYVEAGIMTQAQYASP